MRRFVRSEYAAYSSPNSSTIILSSARMQARSIANAIKFDGLPQFDDERQADGIQR
jgi:hypothetical protein